MSTVRVVVGTAISAALMLSGLSCAPSASSELVAKLKATDVCESLCQVVDQAGWIHPAWGPVTVFAILDRDSAGTMTAPGRAVIAITDSDSEVRWTRRTEDTLYSFRLASPISDSTGNAFLLYNPGRYDGVVVLSPQGSKIRVLRTMLPAQPVPYWRFYNSRLLPQNRSGEYVIRYYRHSCFPSCAEGATTARDYRWSGKDYVLSPRSGSLNAH